VLEGADPLGSVEHGQPRQPKPAAVERRDPAVGARHDFDAERYDAERAGRYARGEGLY
jgi:hypothetical protein